jgi:hypothetical protein
MRPRNSIRIKAETPIRAPPIVDSIGVKGVIAIGFSLYPCRCRP